MSTSGGQPVSMARSVRRPHEHSTRDHLGVEFVETEAEAFSLWSRQPSGLTDGGVDLLERNLAFLVEQQLAISVDDHNLGNRAVPVMGGVAQAVVIPPLQCVRGQGQQVDAVPPDPLQFLAALACKMHGASGGQPFL